MEEHYTFKISPVMGKLNLNTMLRRMLLWETIKHIKLSPKKRMILAFSSTSKSVDMYGMKSP